MRSGLVSCFGRDIYLNRVEIVRYANPGLHGVDGSIGDDGISSLLVLRLLDIMNRHGLGGQRLILPSQLVLLTIDNLSLRHLPCAQRVVHAERVVSSMKR